MPAHRDAGGSRSRDRHAHPIGQLLTTTRVDGDLPSPLIPPDTISKFVPECTEDAAEEKRDPFRIAPEFEDLLALTHRPATVRPWEQIGAPA